MIDAIVNGLSGLVVGFPELVLNWRNLIMLFVGFVLLWLGIKKDCEPLLLLPIAFGCILVNLPFSEVMSEVAHEEGFLRLIFNAGIGRVVFLDESGQRKSVNVKVVDRSRILSYAAPES